MSIREDCRVPLVRAAFPGTILAPVRVRRPRPRLLKALFRSAVEWTPFLGDRWYWRLPAGSSGVALTFDDGPDPEVTPRVLDLLAEFGSRATFFVLGEKARAHPKLVRRIRAEGHRIGNHTYTHARCDRLSRDKLRNEVEATAVAIAEVCGTPPERLFRPPFGALRPGQAVELALEGWRVTLWSQDGQDYLGVPAEAVAAVGSMLEPRDILLLHDRIPATAEALPALLARLAERRLTAVTVG
jgi:peptidoglycan/xylan/chitin deacetylase (PgdA/CDA1 family)